MLLRDYTGDYTQFRYLGGLEPFLEEMVVYARARNDGVWSEEEEDVPPIYYLGDVGMSPEGVLTKHHDVSLALADGGAIVIGLANPHQMRKINAVWDLVVAEGNDTVLSVVIDEADQLMYSEGNVFSPLLDTLLRSSRKANGGIYGISATVMDNLHDGRFSTSDVYVMAPSSNYRGVRDIHHKAVDAIDEALKKKKPAAFFEWDPSLRDFLLSYKDKHSHVIHQEQKHPIVVLVKTERWVRHQGALLKAIADSKQFKEAYTVIIYNGEDTTLYSASLVGRKDIRLPWCAKREHAKKSTPRFHVFRKCSIQYTSRRMGGRPHSPAFLSLPTDWWDVGSISCRRTLGGTVPTCSTDPPRTPRWPRSSRA